MGRSGNPEGTDVMGYVRRTLGLRRVQFERERRFAQKDVGIHLPQSVTEETSLCMFLSFRARPRTFFMWVDVWS